MTDINFNDLLIQPDDVDTVIYHGGCTDGFGSAFACHMYFKNKSKEITYYPAQYGSLPPDVSGKNVIICDFSFKYPVLINMISKANKLAILDHHKTAEEDLKNIPITHKVFRMDHSGAYITWKFFHRTEAVPPVILYIEDNDIWNKVLPQTLEITTFLLAVKFDFAEFEKLLDENYWNNTVIPGGAGMKIQNDVYIDSGIKKASPKFMKINNKYYFVAHLNSSILKSELGNKVFTTYPNVNFSTIYNHNDGTNETYFSLRSTNDREDCSQIAKLFNGGGHRNASAFTLGCIVNNIPALVLDNYKCYELLDNIEFVNTTISNISFRAVVLNSTHHKKHLAKYLLQTRTIDNGNLIKECCSIERNRSNDNTILEDPQMSIVWNYSGFYQKENVRQKTGRYWITLHYLDDKVGITVYEYLKNQTTEIEHCEHDTNGKLIIFTSNNLYFINKP